MNQLRDNQAGSRFELEVDGEIVFADYRKTGSDVDILWVEAPSRLRGTGAADRLMRGLVEMAGEKGWRLHPICGYAAAWLRRHARQGMSAG